VETCFPILDPELAERVFLEELQYYLKDNCQSWHLDADGQYIKIIAPEDEPAFSAQDHLLSILCRKR